MYGGGSSSSSINCLENSNTSANLPSVKSLPAGHDPIFNPAVNSQFTDNSQIKIKPMRLSTGFDQYTKEAPIIADAKRVKQSHKDSGSPTIYGGVSETKSQRVVENKRKSLGKVIISTSHHA